MLDEYHRGYRWQDKEGEREGKKRIKEIKKEEGLVS